ncbi:MAG: hypothetical protein ACRDTA_29390 [Pseudonocardiaceae bacterium]
MPAPPYGFFAPPRSPSRPMYGHRRRLRSFTHVALGLLATIGLMMWAAWLAMAGVAIGGSPHLAAAPAVRELPAAPTPAGSTVTFDQVWTAGNGNTIVAGQPSMDISDSALHPGAPVIRVAVTLTNNGNKDWIPVFTTFGATLDRAPLQESTEGDWKYSAPIVPHTSVTLSKVFLGGGGQLILAVNTPQGLALFTGQV